MYRVDRRIFNIDDTILPQEEDYQQNLTQDRRLLEELFEANSPRGIRRSGLFVFSDLSSAIRYSLKVSDSIIYKLNTDNSVFAFRGDMNLVDIAYYLPDEGSKVAIARRYWDNGSTNQPCWECLFNQAIVTDILNNQQQRREWMREFAITGSIEGMQFYREYLNRE